MPPGTRLLLAVDQLEELFTACRSEDERAAFVDTLVRAAPWDLVLGADLLYERRNVDQLLALLPRLGGEVLLAEPGRPPAARFFDEVELEVADLGERVFRLTGPVP